MPEHIDIVEVGPRDGFQSEPHFKKALEEDPARISTLVDTRVDLVEDLYHAGLKFIEAGSFVSAKFVPLMQGTDQVLARLRHLPPTVFLSVIIANMDGLERAIKAGATEVAFIMAAHEVYNFKNTEKTIDETLVILGDVVREADKHQIPVRGYLSCPFGYHSRGDVQLEDAVRYGRRLIDSGCYEVALSDTLGIATRETTLEVLDEFMHEIPACQLAAHFHDKNGQGLINAEMALAMGIRKFDSSLGPLHGGAITEKAPKNIDTIRLVKLFHRKGFETGVDIEGVRHAEDRVKFRRDSLGQPAPV